MRICYIGKHGSGGNDDEDAITHALRQLGHDVVALPVDSAAHAVSMACDLVLINKYQNVEVLKRITAPKACWMWDQIDSGCPTLRHRAQIRTRWMQDVLPLVDVMFLSDGDFIDRARIDSGLFGQHAHKLCCLPQGADERFIGHGVALEGPKKKILFVGRKIQAGERRASFVEHLQSKWGDQFTLVEHGVHGRPLADLIAAHEVVVAPDFPGTQRYTSNRVWLVLGFGGFLLHPECRALEDAGLLNHEHLVYYANRDHLDRLLTDWVGDESDKDRFAIADSGMRCVIREHTYRHRLEQLLRTVKEVLRS